MLICVGSRQSVVGVKDILRFPKDLEVVVRKPMRHCNIRGTNFICENFVEARYSYNVDDLNRDLQMESLKAAEICKALIC